MQLKKLNKKAFLVVELQPGFVVCSLVNYQKGELTVRASTSVKEISPIKAVEKGLQQLAESIKVLPRQVVMLSSEVISGWMELIIPQNLTESQTIEMLRWELEGNLEGFGTPPSLANLLFHSAYLTQQQKDKIFQTSESENFDPMAAARNYGILSGEEISQFESFVSEYPDANQDYIIAWAASSKMYPNDKRLISVMPKDYANEWIDFFSTHKINLLATYGLTLLDYARIDSKTISGKSIVLLKRDSQYIYATYIKASKIIDSMIYPLSRTELSSELINDIAMHASEYVHFGNTKFSTAQLQAVLAQQNPKLIITELSLNSSPTAPLAALAGLLNDSLQYPIPELKTAAPALAFYKNSKVYWTTVVVLFLLYSIGFHTKHQLKIRQLEEDIQLAAVKTDTKQFALSEHSDSAIKAEQLMKEKKQIEQQIEQSRVLITKKDRPIFYSESLRAISQSIGTSVDLEKLSINNLGDVSISGNSLTEADVYKFSAQFNKKMISWKLRTQNTELMTDPNTGIHTFSIIPKIKE